AKPAGVTSQSITAGIALRRKWRHFTVPFLRTASAVFDAITPLIITYNEAPNIKRTLEKLGWARRIVVVDSGSTDETVDILQNYRHVEVFRRPFTDFASQCNFGIDQVTSPWVLSLDA